MQLPEAWNYSCPYTLRDFIWGLTLITFTRDRSARVLGSEVSRKAHARRIHRHYRQTSLRSASPIFLLLASVCSLRPSVSTLTDP